MSSFKEHKIKRGKKNKFASPFRPFYRTLSFPCVKPPLEYKEVNKHSQFIQRLSSPWSLSNKERRKIKYSSGIPTFIYQDFQKFFSVCISYNCSYDKSKLSILAILVIHLGWDQTKTISKPHHKPPVYCYYFSVSIKHVYVLLHGCKCNVYDININQLVVIQQEAGGCSKSYAEDR